MKGMIDLLPPFPMREDPVLTALVLSYEDGGLSDLALSQGVTHGYACADGAYEKCYPWPSSRLTSVEMQILVKWREETGLPITELLRQSVQELDKIIRRTP